MWEAEAQVRELGPRSAYVLASEDWHPGVVGIVASRIVEHHHRPAVLVALEGESGTGSGRSIPGFDLLGALHDCAPVLDRYGGHRAAAGLTVARERLPEFRAAFELHAEAGADAGAARAQRTGRRGRVRRRARSRAGRGARAAGAVRDREPVAAAARARGAVQRRATDGGGPARALLVSSGGVRARAVAFGCDGRVGDESGEPRDATFKLERNAWNGAVEPGWCCATSSAARRRRSMRSVSPATTSRPSWPSSTGRSCASGPARSVGGRRVIDRRGESPLAVLRDAVAGGGQRAGAVRRRSAAAGRTAGARGRFRARVPPDARLRPGARGRVSTIWCVLDPPAVAELPDRRRRATPSWRGANLSYALLSRCTSWSTDSVLRSSPSTATFGSASGWPARSSSSCSVAKVRTVDRPVWPHDW